MHAACSNKWTNFADCKGAVKFGKVVRHRPTDERTNGFSERARCEAGRVVVAFSRKTQDRSYQPVDPLYMVDSPRYHLQASPQYTQKTKHNLPRIHRSLPSLTTVNLSLPLRQTPGTTNVGELVTQLFGHATYPPLPCTRYSVDIRTTRGIPSRSGLVNVL